MQLRRVVEMAGMIEHCDFDEQVTTPTDDGRLSVPTWSCTCPAAARSSIDAKVPLDAFLQLIEADDDDAAGAARDRHARQLRTHVDQLAKKEYWKQFEHSPELVVAFIPGDQLLAAAFEADPALQEHALANGVVLTTPNTLVAALRTVALSLAAGDAGRERARGPAAGRRALRPAADHDRTHAVAAAQPHARASRPTTRPSARSSPGCSSRRASSRASASSGGSRPRSPSCSPIEAAPRHLQAVEPSSRRATTSHEPTIVALPEGGANTGPRLSAAV